MTSKNLEIGKLIHFKSRKLVAYYTLLFAYWHVTFWILEIK